jgi:hypothetical protein
MKKMYANIGAEFEGVITDSETESDKSNKGDSKITSGGKKQLSSVPPIEDIPGMPHHKLPRTTYM